MKVGEAEIWLREQLMTQYPQGESAAIASLVLEHQTGWDKGERRHHSEEVLNVHQLHHLTEFWQRLQHAEPVQYVLGEAWFAGMKLYVDKNVLIPRPETEELVVWVVKDIGSAQIDVFEKKRTQSDETTTLKILDVGTGSGCIALALKKKMPAAEVWGCDVSEKALNVARRNGSELDIRVDFLGLDFLNESQRRQLPTVDVIVSNPPYISQNEKNILHRNVLDHEPHGALFVPENDQLLFYRALAAHGKQRLYDKGFIYCEIHEDIAREVKDLFVTEGYQHVTIKKDMQGKDRMVKAQLISSK